MEVSEPTGLDLLILVANSAHGPGGHRGVRARPDDPAHDHLVDADDALRFLVDHDVDVPPGVVPRRVLARLARARQAVRRLVERGESPDGGLDEDFRAARFRLDATGRLAPVRGGWDGFADSLLPAIVELPAVRDRLRICGNRLCRWIFVDRSHNRSRVWCEMAVCGNRAKVWRHRADGARRTGRE